MSSKHITSFYGMNQHFRCEYYVMDYKRLVKGFNTVQLISIVSWMPLQCRQSVSVQCHWDAAEAENHLLTQSVCWWMEPEWWLSWTVVMAMLAVSQCCSHGWPFHCEVAGAGWGLVVHEERYSEKRQNLY